MIKTSSGRRITHHGNQHVKQQNWDENHKADENSFSQVRVRDVVQLRVLKREKEVTESINNSDQSKS